jgi:hypothetical protein
MTCQHESLDIEEEVIEEGPIAFIAGEVIYRRETHLYYRCSFCGQRVEGEVPLDYSEEE